MSRAAAVVIGRDEGPRLARCLRSVLPQFDPVVYVDSASRDGSPEVARDLGADVVPLDMSIPFTYGRGRNAGAHRLREIAPKAEFIQFVDADSEIAPNWCARVVPAMDASPRTAALHGRVRERHQRTTLYDHLYDLEFDPRAGESLDTMGGMAMLRVAALQEVGGYTENMQTFEDHELSFRLRRAGWEVRWLDEEMALHEGGMTHWREWWRREARAGHARAQLVRMHGWGADGWRRDLASIWFWGALLPAAGLATAWISPRAALLLTLGYAVLFYRIYRRLRRRGIDSSDAALYAAARVVGKLPQFAGALSFLRQRRTAP